MNTQKDGPHDEVKIKAVKKESREGESIVTLTLVDLYISQGYKNKALDVLEKLISLNPKDPTLKRKREELEGVAERKTGSGQLESYMESRESKEFLLVKGRMNSFLDELKKRAEHFKEA